MNSKLLLVLSISLFGCAAQTTGFNKGENLLIPQDKVPKNWQAYADQTNSTNKLKTVMWQNPEKGFADSYAVTVANNVHQDFEQYRNTQDLPGKENCKVFSSKNLENKITNYPSLAWETSCELSNGNKAEMMHLIIQGKDSFYHIQKTWKYEPSAQEKAAWSAIFNSISVCDTRSSSNACPEMVKSKNGV